MILVAEVASPHTCSIPAAVPTLMVQPATGSLAADWAGANACPPGRADAGGAVATVRYGPCKERSSLVVATVDGAGATWPSAARDLIKGFLDEQSG